MDQKIKAILLAVFGALGVMLCLIIFPLVAAIVTVIVTLLQWAAPGIGVLILCFGSYWAVRKLLTPKERIDV